MARPLKIFATDIDPNALETARKGVYGTCVAGEIGTERLDAHFRCDTSACTVLPRLRENIVFARHDLLRDPPFLGMAGSAWAPSAWPTGKAAMMPP